MELSRWFSENTRQTAEKWFERASGRAESMVNCSSISCVILQWFILTSAKGDVTSEAARVASFPRAQITIDRLFTAANGLQIITLLSRLRGYKGLRRSLVHEANNNIIFLNLLRANANVGPILPCKLISNREIAQFTEARVGNKINHDLNNLNRIYMYIYIVKPMHTWVL